MNVTLFGLGYVGSVTAACLAARGNRVVGVDTDPAKVAMINAGRAPVIEPGLDAMVAHAVGTGALRATGSVADALADADLSIVCVGTPSGPHGGTDLSQVRRVVAEIGAALAGSDRGHTVVIRSTVPPGTVGGLVTTQLEESSGRRVGGDPVGGDPVGGDPVGGDPVGGDPAGGDLQVAMCPEFLREGSSVEDFFAPPLLVIGGTTAAAAAVRALFGFLDCPVHVVAPRSAESLKYASNAFHALKVSFTNELSRLYRMLEVDSRQVMELFVQDRQLNVSPAYLRPGFAFGGSCLPKDLRSLLYLARMNCVDLPVLQAAMASNEMHVREVADRVLLAVDGAGGNRRVALLGLSFKQNTDDLRESPNVALAEILLGKGVEVAVHDPVVNPARLSGANLRFVQARLPHLHKVLHDSPADAVRDAHVAVVYTRDPAVLDAVVAARPPVVLDLNGRLGAPMESLEGYQGVGW